MKLPVLVTLPAGVTTVNLAVVDVAKVVGNKKVAVILVGLTTV